MYYVYLEINLIWTGNSSVIEHLSYITNVAIESEGLGTCSQFGAMLSEHTVLLYNHLNNQFYLDVYDVLDRLNYMYRLNLFFNTRVVI